MKISGGDFGVRVLGTQPDALIPPVCNAFSPTVETRNPINHLESIENTPVYKHWDFNYLPQLVPQKTAGFCTGGLSFGFME